MPLHLEPCSATDRRSTPAAALDRLNRLDARLRAVLGRMSKSIGISPINPYPLWERHPCREISAPAHCKSSRPEAAPTLAP